MRLLVGVKAGEVVESVDVLCHGAPPGSKKDRVLRVEAAFYHTLIRHVLPSRPGILINSIRTGLRTRAITIPRRSRMRSIPL